MLIALGPDREADKDRVLSCGGRVVSGDPAAGWLLEIEGAAPAGEISWRLPDGSVVRRFTCPRAITYLGGGILPGARAVEEWGEPDVAGQTGWLGIVGDPRGAAAMRTMPLLEQQLRRAQGQRPDHGPARRSWRSILR